MTFIVKQKVTTDENIFHNVKVFFFNLFFQWAWATPEKKSSFDLQVGRYRQAENPEL